MSSQQNVAIIFGQGRIGATLARDLIQVQQQHRFTEDAQNVRFQVVAVVDSQAEKDEQQQRDNQDSRAATRDVQNDRQDVRRIDELRRVNGVRIEQINSEQDSEIEHALKNNKIDTLVIVPGVDRFRVQHARKAVRAAKKANVRNIVLLSRQGVEHAQSQAVRLQEYRELEKEVRDQFQRNNVILRTNLLQQDFARLSHDIQEQNKIRLPFGDRRAAPINLRDVAEAVARIVSRREIEQQHADQVYNLTGQQQVNGQELAEHASKGLGKKIQYQETSRDELHKILRAGNHQQPDYEVELLLDEFDLVRDNRLGQVTEDLHKIVNNKKREENVRLEEYFRDNTKEFGEGLRA